MRSFLHVAAVCLFMVAIVVILISGAIALVYLPAVNIEAWVSLVSAVAMMMFCAAFYVLVEIADAVAPKAKLQISLEEKKAA